MPRLFLSQMLVDQWMAIGHIQLDGDLLQFDAAGTQASMLIDPAVLFESVDGAAADKFEVLGRVKTSEELSRMGAEHFDTSVVLGELPYVVRPGFLALPIHADGSEVPFNGPEWSRLRDALGVIAAA
jgi:hypothetical protein